MATDLRYNIPIAKPSFNGEEAQFIQRALNSGWVSMGPMVQEFEKAVAQYTGAPFAVAMSSWTTAMHVGLLIHGIGTGDDVICPSYTFIATANVVRHAGAAPQFVDIDPDTLNIDPKATEAFIEANYDKNLRHKKTGNTLKAIQIVHQIGIPADIDAFKILTKKYNLILLEDSACAIGSTYKNEAIGSHGFTGALSFHPRKVFTTGEGGMLLLFDEKLAAQAKVYRAHGASVSDVVRHQSKTLICESYDVVGYNYKLTDIQAALGMTQLERLSWFLQRRQEIAARYNAAFSSMDALSIITPPDYASFWNYQSYPVRLKNADEETRNMLINKMQEKGIATRRGIPPIHLEPVYAQGVQLPHTEAVSRESLFLPIFPDLSNDEADYVIETFLGLL